MSHAFQRFAIGLLCTALAACGGGGDSGISNANASVATGQNSTAGSNTTASNTSTAASAPLAAQLSAGPADGDTLSGTVTLEVRGSSIDNAELLPPSGLDPKLGVFAVAPDKASARLDFDTTTLPNGTLLARVSAFDKPMGSPDATEAVAMPVRTWKLRNSPEPAPAKIPPASYMPEVQLSAGNLPFVDPAPLDQLKQLDDATLGNMLANEWPKVEAVLRMYIPANVVLVPPTPLGFQGPWSSCIQSHGLPACREAITQLDGLMQGKRPK